MKTCPVCDTDYPDQHLTCPTDGAVLIESRELGSGSLVRGKYRIVRKLGQGGMGVVYLADDILLGVRVALKFLAGDLGKDPRFIKRFRMEARAAYRLRHPNIVEVTGLDQGDDGTLFIAMEYVEGPSLRTLLDHALGGLPVLGALEIARGIASGLAEAHAHGSVHRDIKPENILLAVGAHGSDRPKILDFGLVAVAESVTRLSLTHGLLLTPGYAAPEQWLEMPSAEIDGRTDLYALGCVLYEMLTGRQPLHAHNTAGWMTQHLEVAPRPPSELRPELTEWRGLDTLVLHLLAKDRAHRPANAREVLTELANLRPMPAEPSVPEPPLRIETVWEQPLAPSVADREAVVPMVQPEPEPAPPLQEAQPQEPKRHALMEAPEPERPEPEDHAEIASAAEESARKHGAEFCPADGDFAPTAGMIVTPEADEELGSPRIMGEGLRRALNRPRVRVATILMALAVTALITLHGIAPLLFYQASIGNASWSTDFAGFLYGVFGPNNTSGLEVQHAHACSAGDADACLALGDFFQLLDAKSGRSGYFFKRAKTLFYARCRHSDGGGCYALGILGREGIAVEDHDYPAYYWFKQSCNAGANFGCITLADAYWNGNGVERDLVRAEFLYDKACKISPAECEWSRFDRLGDDYAQGNGVGRDYDRAGALYKKACDGGYSTGCSDLFDIAYDFDEGTGVRKDHTKAAALYPSACNSGIPVACFDLGLSYENGDGVRRDVVKAAALYRKACDGGEPTSCNNLGVKYERGESVEMDIAKAATLYKKACDGGEVAGCGNLGDQYWRGAGVGQDKAMGKGLLERACQAKNDWSCNRLKELDKEP